MKRKNQLMVRFSDVWGPKQRSGEMLKGMPRMKRKNPPDATRVNVRAAHKREAALLVRLQRLERRVNLLAFVIAALKAK